MSTKFTQGPWVFEGLIDCVCQKETGMIVCDVDVPQDNAPCDQECQSNADLIAAAPDMYEALESIEWRNPESGDGPRFCIFCGKYEHEGHREYCKIGNVIRKARGGK